MDLKKKIEENFNVNFVESESSENDLNIRERTTADGYSIYVVMGPDSLKDPEVFEYDVYYYEPPVEELLERFEGLKDGASVYVNDFEAYFNEPDVIEYIDGM